MEYCNKCKMPKLQRGLDRCYCEPIEITTDEEQSEILERELFAKGLEGPQRHWLAPITDPIELKDLILDPADLPVSVYCIGDSRVYDNTGTGWTYIDDDGFRQDVVLAKSSQFFVDKSFTKEDLAFEYKKIMSYPISAVQIFYKI